MTCPICTSESAAKYRPFCSKRCADLDLAQWLNGSYALPSDDPEDITEAPEATARALAEAPPKPH